MENRNVGVLLDVQQWHREVLRRHFDGARFAGLYGSAATGGCRLTVLLATGHGFDCLQTLVRPDAQGLLSYPSLSAQIPAAFWYERAAHDLSGVLPLNHPRLDPLLLPLEEGSELPHPGGNRRESPLQLILSSGPVDVSGRGMFAIPFGPVRSGVFESIEFLIETPGEDIPHLNIRPHYKHRGIAKRFEGLNPADGVLVAERVEGIASVAHALAFSHAAEAIAGTIVPTRARLLRVIYAELERIANHLDVAMRLADAAGLSVATSRFSWHKESVLRLISQMCGSRFGRGAVLPGGVHEPPALALSAVTAELSRLHRRIRTDATLAMKTPSFLDRIRGTGILSTAAARSWAALGPIARASGLEEDNRWRRGTDAYPELRTPTVKAVQDEGDAMARLKVRWTEIDGSVELILEAGQRLAQLGSGAWNIPLELPPGDAFDLGWAESPQGETLYGLALRDGQILRCFARSASFHNLVMFHSVFNGDVFTDFAFIEASFGLCYAGVAM